MNEIILLVVVGLFSDGPQAYFRFQPDMETCWRKADAIYAEAPETYIESGVSAVWADCIRFVPRQVKKPGE